MARAEQQDLTAVLTLRDQLSGPLAAAKGNLTATENSLASVSRTAQATGSSLGGFGTSLGQIAKAGAAAFGAFKALDIGVDFFAGAIQGAREEEVGIARLTASLKANAQGWDGNAEAVEKTIDSRQRLGFADDELRDSLTRILPATHDINEALAVQNVAMDLARFKNVSLADASVALTKVEAGKFRALAELGIVLKDGATQTDALAAVEKAAAGQAEAFAETTAGAAARVDIAFHNLQETVGGPLNEVMAGFFETVENGGDLLDTVGRKISEFTADKPIGQLGDAAAGASPQIAGLGKTVDALVISLRDQVRWSLAGRDAIDIWGAGIGKAAGTDLPGLVRAAQDAEHANNNLQGAVTGLTAEEIKNALAAGQTAEAHARLTDALGETGDHFGRASDLAVATANSLDAEVVATIEAALATFHLGQELDALPREVTIDVVTRFTSVGAGAFGVGEFAQPPAGNTNFAPTQGSTGDLGGTTADPEVVKREAQRKADEARRAAEKAASEAARKAKQEAEELARVYHDKVDAEFAKAKKTADTLFDALHDRHLQAIKDAETLAEKEHDAALQKIADNLKAQQAANAAPVNAAEAALRDRQAEQQRRDLVESLQGAQTAASENRDPARQADLERQLRAAREALENFDASATIERLKAVQSTLDAQAQKAADAAKTQADKDFDVAQARAETLRKAEAVADDRTQFESQLAALKARDEKANKTPAAIQADIDALSKGFGITIDPVTGFRHIEDPIVRAIKDVKITTGDVNVNTVVKAVLQLGPNELRLIASAIQIAQSPAATSGARTGASR